ncbi:hypothetical protein CDQ84_06400 [Clostridium thermosuccinogenes]|uniref:Uncharacterized protein n=1 Tax=Clostridium thermosuccinogenes TaxID=84032 RepID=A0A2K2F3U5_9CLOT|nr:hypothetical protein CDO33_04860 [Pseudoclostridium thermosuccinogenes]PNT93455.1 hypothetical protein CDQ83_08100 [Pseudoclostridium thermosuccinogenes]PNT98347.1 hypothetical protein CDQ85_05905 [Pseudoclostridium thermosuccinogenes]PNU00448.1 hypothetical protein CDQ84_06400 [Pseudoclostridium thermosuccinogenes]
MLCYLWGKEELLFEAGLGSILVHIWVHILWVHMNDGGTASWRNFEAYGRILLYRQYNVGFILPNQKSLFH